MATTEIFPGLAGVADGARIRAPAAALAAIAAWWLARCRQWSAAEAGRLALWAPVAIGAGVALYFSLKAEPPAWAGPAVLCVSLAARLRFARWRSLLAAILFAGLGFTAADLRAARVEAPVLAQEMKPAWITGRLLSVEESPKSRRLIIGVTEINGVAPEALPKRVRVTWRGKEFNAFPGDVIRLRAGLSPPPPPVAPGAFDFARQLYFERIGAVGFAVTAPEIAAAAPPTLANRAAASIEKARLTIARRITDQAPGQGGAIVAAVVTGKRAAINAASEAALRDSGLAHLLAISGLHMGLATGLIFFAVRFALAAIEPIALRYPIKKWAAAAALLSGFLYLLLSRAGWSAQRAFIMSSVMFAAILFDRRALSLRNVAIAATVIILITPEAVMHPGFQMSFAAVTALIAAYEWGSRRADPDRDFTLFARLWRYVFGIAITDTIAAAATSPYSFFHFNRSANYGLAANIISIPIMGFWVMPAAILALLLMPFGADGFAWRLSAGGVNAILAVGGWVAARPGAVFTVAQWPPLALGVLTLGGLWLCLQSAPWRVGGLAAIPLAAILIALAQPPSLFISDEGDNVAIALRSGGEHVLALYNPRKDKFSAGVWKEQTGLDRDRTQTFAMGEVGKCDLAGCVVPVEGKRVAVSSDPLALREDCRRADLVIALYPVAESNAKPCAARLIDREVAWDEGVQAIWIEGDSFRIRTVREARGARPWSHEETARRFTDTMIGK